MLTRFIPSVLPTPPRSFHSLAVLLLRLIDWWNGLSYFGYRDSVVINVSYFYQLKNEAKDELMNPALRGARFIKGSLQYRRLVVTEELAPETSGKGMIPQDMSSKVPAPPPASQIPTLPTCWLPQPYIFPSHDALFVPPPSPPLARGS